MVLGEIAALAAIAKAAKQGYDAVKKLQPEYGRFWKAFERELKPRSMDIPWARIESLRLSPEFIGEACGLIRGDWEKRKAMRKRVVALVVRPEKGQFEEGEIVELVMKAADASAVKAISDDRYVTVQQGQMIQGQLAELAAEFEKMQELIREVGKPLGGDAAALREPLQPRRDDGGWALSTAELKLRGILGEDPGIGAALESICPDLDETSHVPDFAVRDEEGTNWLIEVKSDASLQRPEVRRQVRALADLTTRAADDMSGDWRFMVLTPSNLADSTSWSDIRASARDLL